MAGSRRNLLIFVLSSIVLVPLGCCAIGVGLIDRFVLFHVYSYETSSPARLRDVSVDFDVRPQNRTNNPPPDRLAGPPYEVCVIVRDRTRKTVAVRLRRIQIRTASGETIDGKVTRGHNRFKPDRAVFLYSNFSQGEWGRRPTMVAELELEYADTTVRETAEIMLRPRHTRDLYIP